MSGYSYMGSMKLPTDFKNAEREKERQTYILWADEGRMDERARRVIQMNGRAKKTDAMQLEGKECFSKWR